MEMAADGRATPQDAEGYCAGEYATAGKHHQVVELLMEWGVEAELILATLGR